MPRAYRCIVTTDCRIFFFGVLGLSGWYALQFTKKVFIQEGRSTLLLAPYELVSKKQGFSLNKLTGKLPHEALSWRFSLCAVSPAVDFYKWWMPWLLDQGANKQWYVTTWSCLSNKTSLVISSVFLIMVCSLTISLFFKPHSHCFGTLQKVKITPCLVKVHLSILRNTD